VSQLLRLFVQIALLRRGPQDVPASQLLLALTVAAYFLVNFAVSSVLPPFPGPWLGQLCVDVVFMLVWYALLLNLVRRPERFLQTTIAVYGFQVVLSPLLVAASWLMLRFEQDPVWQFPATLVSLALFIWIVTANSHIVKAALEWSTPPSTVLVILQTMASYLLAQALFPIPTS
jgi:hypothetical protein